MPGSALRSRCLDALDAWGMLSKRRGSLWPLRAALEELGGRSGCPLLSGCSPISIRCASLSPGRLIAT